MEKRNKKDFTTICIRKIEYKKLKDYQDYGSEPMWIVIKRVIENEESK